MLKTLIQLLIVAILCMVGYAIFQNITSNGKSSRGATSAAEQSNRPLSRSEALKRQLIGTWREEALAGSALTTYYSERA